MPLFGFVGHQLCPRYITMAAATTGPGFDVPGEWFIGAGNTTALVLGKERALVVDNTTTPPSVSVQGAPLGSASGLFGNAADGDRVLTENLEAGVDLYYNDLTLNAGVVLKTNGWRIFVRGVLTLEANARIDGDGDGGQPGDQFGAGAGGVALAAGTLGKSGAGQTGGTPLTLPVNGESVVASVGGAGGAGGDGTGGQLGADGGSSAAPNDANGGVLVLNDAGQAIRGRDLANTKLSGGAGGGGGGCAATGVCGGGGGAGGRVVLVAAATITGSGTITARGGRGGDSLDVAEPLPCGGGGGGGGGGAVILITKLMTGGFTTGQLIASGGLGGFSYDGSGTDGVPGLSGRVYVHKV